MIRADVICDSVSPDGARLITLQVTFHRYILAEFNTHRAFSRNSASSRARSVKKTIEEVRENPAMPPGFPTERRGMAGGESIPKNRIHHATSTWYTASRRALTQAERLVELGVHKSVVNRLLEPFMRHTAVVTATDWTGFFDQRLALNDDGMPAADPAMYLLARKMKRALDDSTPVHLEHDEWHLPYITEIDRVNASALDTRAPMHEILKQASVARCAGTSYLTQDKKDRDLRDDLRIYDMLASANPPHWSPFEHVARPSVAMNGRVSRRYNLHGWESMRYILENRV